MGRVALPQMKRYNYHPRLATGCVAAGGTLDADAIRLALLLALATLGSILLLIGP